ncbi:MAG: mechanosensitive ion channel domain-containing protein [Pyrodictiaceae archaeon]
MILENLTINTTEIANTISASLSSFTVKILLPILIAVLIAYIFLRVIHYILSKLAERRLITTTLVDQIYKPLTLLTYTLLIFIIIYVATGLREIVFLIIVFIVIALLASYNVLSDLIAYYVILWSGRLRVGDLVELPTLNVRGRVISIDTTATTIRRSDGTLAHIPNRSIVSSPLNILSQSESRLHMRIKIALPKDTRNAVNTIIEVEEKIRDRLLRTKLVSRPQNIIINLKLLRRYNAVIEVVIPLALPEPRTYAINSIISSLTDALLPYDPEFIIVSPEAERIIRG